MDARITYDLLTGIADRGKWTDPEDVLLVELPDGRFVDVTYFPEKRSYRVALFPEDWGRIVTERWRSTPDEVARTVEEFVTGADI